MSEGGAVRRAPLLVLAVACAALGCARAESPTQAARRRCLSLVESLPRYEAEERAWPRSASLACEERAQDRAAELLALRRGIAESCAAASGGGDIAPLLEATDEVIGCAACGEGYVPRCRHARELFVEMDSALRRARLR